MKSTGSSRSLPTSRATSWGRSRRAAFDRPSWTTSNTRGSSCRPATSIPTEHCEIVMIGSELWHIYALVFGAVLLGMQGLYWVLFKERHEQKIVNRRLALTAQLANPAEVLDTRIGSHSVSWRARCPIRSELNSALSRTRLCSVSSSRPPSTILVPASG